MAPFIRGLGKKLIPTHSLGGKPIEGEWELINEYEVNDENGCCIAKICIWQKEYAQASDMIPRKITYTDMIENCEGDCPEPNL